MIKIKILFFLIALCYCICLAIDKLITDIIYFDVFNTRDVLFIRMMATNFAQDLQSHSIPGF